MFYSQALLYNRHYVSFLWRKIGHQSISGVVKRMLCPSSCFNLCIFLIRFRGAVSWYTVDLDLPPTKRWTAVITDKKANVRRLLNT